MKRREKRSVAQYCRCDDSYCRDCMRPRRTKDKTVQRAIVLLYLRMRRARRYYQQALTLPVADDVRKKLVVGTIDAYIEAHNALETMKRVLWHDETPFVGREAWFLGGRKR